MKKSLRISLGADHRGSKLKSSLISHLQSLGCEIFDLGTDSEESCNYSDFANKVSEHVIDGLSDMGILVCHTGIGMSIAANRSVGIRAALVHSSSEAEMTRLHNNANVLCLAAGFVSEETAKKCVDVFLSTDYEGGRHEARLVASSGSLLLQNDPELAGYIADEKTRQRFNVELIASENFTSRAVQEAQGSLLTNKYAEGYPGKRWYGGCENVDKVEQLAIDRAKQLFGAEHANVQPHSGSQANTAVYFSVLKPGDTILTMDLSHGGHLTHGHKANFSGSLYHVVHYGVALENEQIDYDALEKTACEVMPAMITAGASAYPRVIDFERMAKIAKKCGAYLFVDMAHIAGLVAAGVHPTPMPHADFVTTTTHKSLRGPRGGIVFCKAEFAKKIDAQVFPGIQGGPLMHVIAGKAACFGEALKPEFSAYQEQVVKNAKAMAARMAGHGFRIVSGGTENHLFLVDLRPIGINGAEAQVALDEAAITVNKNTIPFDTGSPMKPSGIRIGTPAVTTRGMKVADVEQVADFVAEVLKSHTNLEKIHAVREKVRKFMERFPMP